MINAEKKVLLDILRACQNSTKMTASILFPERFFLKFSGIHNTFFEWLDEGDEKLRAAAAPRGFGKTSILQAFSARGSLSEVFRSHFTTMISATATQAVLQSENLKRELVSNKVIKALYGIEKTDQFSKEQWVLGRQGEDLFKGTMFLPRGSGQQVRGISFGHYRPDRIILDDMEDPEKVLNPLLREQLKQWLNADVLNSVNQALPYRIVLAGTILHEESLLENLLKSNSGWKTIRLSICDDSYRTNWPELISQDELDKKIKYHRDNHTLDVFAREYMNQPIAAETAAFKKEYFKYYSELEEKLNDHPDVETVILVDPARTTTELSDETAINAIAINLKTGQIYIREVDNGRYMPDEILSRMFDMAGRYKARVIGVEETGLNQHIMWHVGQERIKRRFNCEIIPIKASGKKEDRILQLQTFYKNGQILHNDNPVMSGALELQLLAFPRCKFFDVADATAHIVTVMDEQERFFWFHVGADWEDESLESLAATSAKDDAPMQMDWF